MASSPSAALLDYVLSKSRPGDIQSVIDTIDDFAYNKTWLMNIGDIKGKILDDAIRERNPTTILELGTFLGYSSLRMAAQTSENVLIVTIEANPGSAKIAQRVHEHAGVAHRIHIVNDVSDKAIPQLNEKFHIDSFDLIFIDHYSDAFLPDLKLLEQLGLIKQGTMIVADNVITPGAPEYLKYVRKSPNYTSKFHESKLEYSKVVPDGVEVSVRL